MHKKFHIYTKLCFCYLPTGESTEPLVLTQVRRSTRKTPNKYRRKSTVSRSSTSEDNETSVTMQPNKVAIKCVFINFTLLIP